MRKGATTCNAILNEAVNLCSELGLEGLTIGNLAKRVGMSKSGLYAHFDSKESLQRDVLQTASDRFIERVLKPALAKERGLPRLTALFENWLVWGDKELRGGCIFIAAATEFDDRPGTVRQQIADYLEGMLDSIARVAGTAVASGNFHKNLDCEQFAFEFWGIIVSYQHHSRLLKRPDSRERANRAFEQLVRVSASA